MLANDLAWEGWRAARVSIPSRDVRRIAAAGGPAGPRVLLLVPARTYRAADFLLAAARMGLDLVIGSAPSLPMTRSRPIRVAASRKSAAR